VIKAAEPLFFVFAARVSTALTLTTPGGDTDNALLADEI
jgi:hypothetical protein